MAFAILLLFSVPYTVQADSKTQLIQIDKSIRLRDYTLAVKQLRPLVEQNVAQAQFRMAGLYRSGKGIKKDIEQALILYEKAAQQGHADAQYTFASLLEKRGFKVAAESWYQQAAKQGQPKAKKKLALLKKTSTSPETSELSNEKIFSSILHNDVEFINSLIKGNYNFSIYDKSSRTPLMAALLAGQKDMSLALLPVTKNPDHSDKNKDRAVHIASTQGYENIIGKLIEHKIDIDAQNDLGNTALMIAIRHDNAGIVDLLLKHKADPRLKNRNGRSAVDIARTTSQANIVKVFTRYKIDLKTKPKNYADLDLESFQQSIKQSASLYKSWPLLSIASLLGEKEIVKQLISQGVNINETDDSGYSPLHRAASKGNIDSIKLLLSKGANINAVNHKNETPLFLAAESGKLKSVNLLLQKGADTSILTTNKNSALLVAINNRRIETAMALVSGKLDKLSIHHALNQSIILNMPTLSLALIKRDRRLLNKPDKNMRSVLWHSANLGQQKVISALLKNKSIDLNQKDINGYTPLARAVLKGHVNIVRQLINRDARLDILTKENNSLLMLAVLPGKAKLTKLLLDKGIDPNIKNNAGDSALMLAAAAGNNDMIEILIKSGADIQIRNQDDLNAYQIASNAGHKTTAELIRQHSGRMFKLFN